MKGLDEIQNNILENLHKAYEMKQQLIFCDDIIDIYNHKYKDYQEYVKIMAYDNDMITKSNAMVFDKNYDNYNELKLLKVTHLVISDKLFTALINKK